MTFTAEPLPELSDVVVITPRVHADDRGLFLETWHADKFRELGLDLHFAQDNHSASNRGVLRGLHYQLPPFAQGKLVRVAHGEVFDAVVDLRRSSPNFGKWAGWVLSDVTHQMLWIPEGFAHGFLVLSKTAIVGYKATARYSAEHERAIRWDDERIGIDWPDVGTVPVLSAKDASATGFDDADVFP